jgi:hypothetical protein
MVPHVPCVPGIGIRGSRNRTKHNSDARGEDQNFTHRMALFVVPPALRVVGITPRARSGFRRATVTNDCAWNKTNRVAIARVRKASIGQTYELTGPRSQDMRGIAAEYADALGRPITLRRCAVRSVA